MIIRPKTPKSTYEGSLKEMDPLTHDTYKGLHIK